MADRQSDRFTSRWIEAVKVDIRTDFTDPKTPGLILRVTPNGVKSWAYLYRRQSDKRRRRVTLGKFPAMGLKEARVAAAGHLKGIAAGADPAHQTQEVKKIDTVDQLLDRYIKDQGGDLSWAREVERIFKKDVRPVIGGYKINKVSRPDIVNILNAVKDRGAGVGANRTLAAVRRAFNWGIEDGLLTSPNPASGIPPRVKEETRSRALSEAEIRKFWIGLDGARMASGTRLALRLALVTGQRIGEVCGALRSEVDLKKAEWLIPGKRVKNRREHYVPLSPLAVRLFNDAFELAENSKFLFPSKPRSRSVVREQCLTSAGVGHAMRGALEELGLTDDPATPHDLRRTVASQMAAMGIGENVVARVLNHASEIGKTITGAVYIRHSFAAEKRHALEAWGDHLFRIVTGSAPASNVVRFKPSAQPAEV